ncbi:RNase H family protein [Dinoroseobacter sp. S76]|uniref:RNase H family protein n=1 Tax=Dinoroseobacter sp. S76 TaxID=3415124 RepID=UPI003C7B8860
MGRLFDQCTKQDTLHKAWRRIRSNGLRSKADETRQAIEDFERTTNRNISRIQSRLRSGEFKFDPQKGVLKTKSSGGKRGIVMASVHNRVVERALLDVLQDKVEIARQAGKQPSSFGGVPHRSVPHALKFLYDAFETGHTYYIRSDISGFFDGIPRKSVLDRIKQDTDDTRLLALLEEATTVTLGNEEVLGEDRRVFPTDEQGVAQGSPLSPLFGNILLQPFDERFNERGVLCARFIDDFVLLGTTQTKVRKAFNNARNYLAELDLRCHDPFASNVSPDKAQQGHVDDGFDFLGYNCRPGLLQPSRSARQGILETVRNHFSAGRGAIREVRKTEDSFAARQRYAQTLVLVDRVLRGWGESFAYCNSMATMDDLDRAIDETLDDFRSWFAREMEGADRKARRRMGGVGLLTDIEAKSFDDVPFQVDAGGRFRTSAATVTISTDGALCSGKRQKKKERRPGGWALVVHDSGEERAGYDLATTNNRMELTAVIEALRCTEAGASVIIRTDSQYVHNVRNEGAVVKQNSDLWKEFEAEAQKRRVKITWIKGHAGDPHNERADKLAGLQAEEARLMCEENLVPDPLGTTKAS